MSRIAGKMRGCFSNRDVKDVVISISEHRGNSAKYSINVEYFMEFAD